MYVQPNWLIVLEQPGTKKEHIMEKTDLTLNFSSYAVFHNITIILCHYRWLKKFGYRESEQDAHSWCDKALLLARSR